MQTSSFVDKLSGFSGMLSQLDQFQFALSGALSNDDKKQLSKMAIQLLGEWNQHAKDVVGVLHATANLDADIPQSKAGDGLNVGSSNLSDEAQVEKEIAKLEPLEGEAKKLLDDLKRLREKRSRFKSDLISGDWDSPLAKVLHEAKDHFLLDVGDVMMLAMTSKGVREALRDVPMDIDGCFEWEVQDDRAMCSLPPLLSEVRPLIVNADVKHYYKGRPKKLKLFLPTQHMKKLDSLCFSPSGAGMYDIALSNSLFPNTLTSLTLTAERAGGLFGDNAVGDKMTLLCQPNLELGSIFPSLLSLDLSHVKVVMKDDSPFVLPPRLKKLALRHVTGLTKLRWGPAWANLTQVHLIGMPLRIAKLPENVEELYIPTKHFLEIADPPTTLQHLRFDFPRESSILNPQAGNEMVSHYAQVQKLVQQLPALKTVDLYHAPFAPILQTPNVPFVSCESEKFDRSQCTTNIVVGPAVRRVVIKNFPKVENIEFQGEVERIGIQGLDQLKTLTVPATCKILKITECPQLAEVVFQGCTLDAIEFSRVDSLVILREEDGAVLPADLKSVLDEHGQYPQDLPGFFLFLHQFIVGMNLPSHKTGL